MKRAIFRHFWWLGPLAGAATLAALWPLAGGDRGTLAVSTLAAVLSVSFFIQQQKLAEMQLFKQLIVEFNQRYDALNGRLQAITEKGTLSAQDRCTVTDYFNLCAEEYLFFVEGYIDERVWRSWSNGMRANFRSPVIAELWALERHTDSYYGFVPPT